MQEALLLMTAAAGVMILMLAIILLVRKRMRRGEIVQATVHRVDLEDSDASDTIAVTLTYTFPWQGRRGRPWRSVSAPDGGSFRLWKVRDRSCVGIPSAAVCGNYPPAVLW